MYNSSLFRMVKYTYLPTLQPTTESTSESWRILAIYLEHVLNKTYAENKQTNKKKTYADQIH